MLLLFIIPILASGFYHQLNHQQAFIRLHRYKGQLLYLRCLSDGLSSGCKQMLPEGFVSKRGTKRCLHYAVTEKIQEQLPGSLSFTESALIKKL